jgi:hypothetical protein
MKATDLIALVEADREEDIATLKKFDSMFTSKFNNLGLKVYQKPKFGDYLGYGATVIYTQMFPANVSSDSDIKPITGNNWRAMIWLDSDINPHGITGAHDMGRTFSIRYQVKGLRKASKEMQRYVKSGAIAAWDESEVLKFYDYGRTPEEVMKKFSQWMDSKYQEFRDEHSK